MWFISIFTAVLGKVVFACVIDDTDEAFCVATKWAEYMESLEIPCFITVDETCPEVQSC